MSKLQAKQFQGALRLTQLASSRQNKKSYVYFIDIEDEHGLTKDMEGGDFPNKNDAYIEAFSSLSQIISDRRCKSARPSSERLYTATLPAELSIRRRLR